ncbi:MAG: hypothetical protein EBT79_10515 [Actinobacteria bacterium]|nr:hypothetical protein [Actinomycetota bacterium]NBR67685.1 hypothetical protein [Actinomycetota bacterium]
MRFKPTRPEQAVQFRVRGSYMGAWARGVGEEASAEIVRRMAVILQEEVQRAAREEATPRTKGSGQPLTLPNTESFFNSFKTRVKGKKTVEVVCTYPFIRALTEGREPYPMTWLTRAAGVPVVPIERADGTVILRATPGPGDRPWVHPGFLKHRFLDVAVKRARERIADVAADALGDAAIKHLSELVKK